MPQFSILMANYNNGAFIDEAIRSVLAQSFSDWELIIVDDVSQDDSLKRIEKYRDDPRIKLYVKDKNEGYTRTLIYGLAKVNSEIVGILDSDDALAPEALEKVFQVHTERPELGLILTQMVNCDSALKPVFSTVNTEKHLKEPLLWGRGGTAFRAFKLDAYRKTAGLDTRILYAEDRDLLFKFEEVAPVHRIDEPLYIYRRQGTSASQAPLQHFIGRRSFALALYNAYLRRRRTSVPNLPRHVLLSWTNAAVRYSLELGEPMQGLAFALRGLRIAPFDGAAYRSLAAAATACMGAHTPRRAVGDRGDGRGVTRLTHYPSHLLQSNTGNVQPDRVVCIPLVHSRGHCLFGGDHYILETGTYVATFEVAIDPYAFAEDPIAVLDIFENLKTDSILAERQVKHDDLAGRPRAFNVEFSAIEGQRVEFRIFWSEQCFLRASGVALDQVRPAGPQS